MSAISKSKIKQITESGSLDDLRELIGDLASRVETLETNKVEELDTSGSGNAVTGYTKSGKKLTLKKDSTFSLSNHTHLYAGSSSAGGSAQSVANSLTILLNGGTSEGTNKFTFNGSATKSVNITYDKVGAASSGHTHTGTYVDFTRLAQLFTFDGGESTGVEGNTGLPYVEFVNGGSVTTRGKASKTWSGSSGNYSYTINYSDHKKGKIASGKRGFTSDTYVPRVKTYSLVSGTKFEEVYDSAVIDISTGNVTVYSNTNTPNYMVVIY